MTNLNRCYGQGYLHYITTSCYQRRPLLALASRRDLFVEVLEHVRRRYHFVVVGYVAMPEHIHLLLCEPERGNPSTVKALHGGSWEGSAPRLPEDTMDLPKITSGNAGSMISSCGARRNAMKSCTTFTRIR